jgi:hypothetical protein
VIVKGSGCLLLYANHSSFPLLILMLRFLFVFLSSPLLLSRIDGFGVPCMHGFNHAIPPRLYIEGLDQLDD